MKKNKKYWKGIGQLKNDPNIEKLSHNEFAEELPLDDFLSEDLSTTSTSRRDFLKFLGFSTAAATLASCESPIVKSIPYVVKPDEITPGVANYYATSIYDGRDYASVLVKNREGRPIKIENNKTCTNARVQASVLSLYDSARLRNPIKNGEEADWLSLDSEIKERLANLNGKKIVLLTSTIISPSLNSLIDDFSSQYSNVSHVMYDSIAYDGMLNANMQSFGLRAIPNYYFDKANIIVSFGADFIGNWLNNDYSTDYIKGRNPKTSKMSKHYQIETNLSLTGSNADKRIPIKPSEQKMLLSDLYVSLAKGQKPNDSRLTEISKKLLSNKGQSLIVCDSNDVNTQLIVNGINSILDNYNKTLSLKSPSYIRQGDSDKVDNLIQEMNAGQIGALITYNVNPSYNLYNAKEFDRGLSKVDVKISTASYNDETASLMEYVCPNHHNLESWGDCHPSHNTYTLMQPTIAPLFNTRQFEETLLRWMNKENYHRYLSDFWKEKGVNWEQAVHDGFFVMKDKDPKLKSTPTALDPKLLSFDLISGIEIAIYEKIGIGDGTQANNPWLQEFPDPISRACWDNYMTVSATTARELNLKNWNVSNGALNGSIVNIKSDNIVLKNVPVMIQPGQTNNTVGLALGYGRTKSGKAANNVGFNAFPLLRSKTVSIEIIEGEHEFASIQLHHTMMGRDMVKETTLADYIKDPASGNDRTTYPTFKGDLPSDKLSLYDEHDLKTGHFWNLSVDLTACTGCGECVISCQAENNIPVVGKEEMRRSRDMHWMRIDRYYSSEMTKEKAKDKDISAIKMYKDMEVPSENPEVVFQPVMCQHCNNAPCENVCPVAATTHSSEGLNQMTYNRCVGTRYCANNCPYKVRRFNWFQYSENEKFDFNMNDDYGKMVLNPDVVVRSRGVIEKCSMCIQKIQELKLTAKKEGRPILDEEAQTVCASSCSTNAIVFGDANNPESEVSKLKKDERAYDLLDHLNVNPSVFYQTKVRNKS
ncbi:MAG: TAT-variant-translocated molybdopterin oxidoreductase [Bacteroidota bacterium]|nr:TAT-variant-translocated molybdopterin oxidoreductase [Bacteroidota bacterium]